MSVLDRESFLEAAKAVKRPAREVSVAGLGQVRVQGLTVGERTRFEMSCMERGKVNPRELREKLVAMCLVDEGGRRLLPDDGDRQVLSSLPAAVIEPLFDAARELSGMTDADVADLGNG